MMWLSKNIELKNLVNTDFFLRCGGLNVPEQYMTVHPPHAEAFDSMGTELRMTYHLVHKRKNDGKIHIRVI